MPDRPATPHLYPDPTLVVGIGRVGLALLEELGQDWRWLSRTAADDTSVKNLRLLSILPNSEVDDLRWRHPEVRLARIALLAGDDDLPTLTLHFAIIRSLGLIRFRDGSYQLAIPRDRGPIETGHSHKTRRKRFFDWLPLDSDPRRAVERLHRLASRDPEVDLFLTPIVERVLHGQSPRLLLNLIARARAYSQGRDPSPWSWLSPHIPHDRGPGTRSEHDRVPGTRSEHDRVPGTRSEHDRVPGTPSEHDRLPGTRSSLHLTPTEAWAHEDDRHPALRAHIAPPPSNNDGTSRPIIIPPNFCPVPGDLTSPLAPRRLLSIDWETTGWVASELDTHDTIEFLPLDLSPFRLGLFDHDASPGFDHDATADALKELGDLLHRGLLRIWLDLQQERHEDPLLSLQERRRLNAEASAEQCLELLAELVVEPLTEKGVDSPLPRVSHRPDRWVDGPTLPLEPSPTLRQAIVDTEDARSSLERPLLQRLRELGLNFGLDELGERPLFRSISLRPDDLNAEARLTPLRSVVNQEARHLLSFDHLSSYRQRASRQPPRLTVYLVADAKEPFTRRALRPVLRAIHQELIRAYGPLLDTSRQGFDRTLAIVPIIWTPHPADAFGGEHPQANITEEASILKAVHDLRRWVESVPPAHRCIPQIFVNSRVTASAVLGLDDAIRQTLDFISLQIRNELGRDPWLRHTAQGFDDNDLFATFSCIQINFPAERARDYLSNRLARESLRRLKTPSTQSAGADTKSEDHLDPVLPPPRSLLDPAREKLAHLTSQTASRLCADVDDRLQVSTSTTSEDLRTRFDEAFEDHLFKQVHNAWHTLTRQRGDMDLMVNALRQDANLHLLDALTLSRKNADRLIEERAADGGLAQALTGFNLLHQNSRNLLDDAERQRISAQELCLKHNLPDPAPIARARHDLIDAANQKPDLNPLRLGLVTWAILAPALGAPLAHAAARALNLHQQPNFIEPLLGPAGWLVGGLLAFLPLALLLRAHLRAHLNRVHDAIDALSNALRDVVMGSSSNPLHASPSIHSFFAARLDLSHALSTRNVSDHLHDRVDADRNLAFRLIQSVELQERRLQQHAESLGARPAPHDVAASSERLDDDVQKIFSLNPSRPGATRQHTLLAPELLLEHYHRHFPALADVEACLPEFLTHAGGFHRWREQACLASTESILGFGRNYFGELLTTPVGAQPAFELSVGLNLASFVSHHYASLGFGARFVGYEGFDTSGIRKLADASLLIHPQLRPALDRARTSPDAPPTTETLDVIEAPILPNTAFLLSLVQGINARSIKNLRRQESFFDRLDLPDPATPWQHNPITIASRHRSGEPGTRTSSDSTTSARVPGTHTSSDSTTSARVPGTHTSSDSTTSARVPGTHTSSDPTTSARVPGTHTSSDATTSARVPGTHTSSDPTTSARVPGTHTSSDPTTSARVPGTHTSSDPTTSARVPGTHTSSTSTANTTPDEENNS
ncbi:hypothetical protein FRC98_13045 [Lujinxingia vulgaris]|uniref:Uncharacterized protein n=1 Tax=Lujinxingia vulgaris TaxID=2600176 RepID=A0A5C6X4J3_9DELT|nr:hypothetical protein [Lujinxingia vulgaris]TXD36048.1 hypothetical protein FRC98_13045 [Lujinxingia vulgaris]